MTLLFTSILIAALLLSCYKLWLAKITPLRKLVLLIIRVALFILILGVFFQPSFKINRLASHENNILVLLDCSSSMQLFNSDSIGSYLSKILKSPVNSNNQLMPHFTVFGFGDSLRQIPAPLSEKFNDNTSRFPRFLTNNQLKKHRKVLIISDGNWTNTTSPHHSIRDKECYYLPMQQRIQIAYLHIEAPALLHSIVSDTNWTVPVQLSGFTEQNKTITLRCSYKQQSLTEKSMVVDSGFFTETRAIKIPAKKAGTRLLELSAQLGDSLISKRYILQNILPNKFTAYLHAPYPSLDKRFLTLAMARQA